MTSARPTSRSHRLRAWLIVAGAVIVIAAAALAYLAIRLEPILRGRVVRALGERFSSKVDLAALHVSLFPRIRVSGEKLVMRYQGRSDIPPLIAVRSFSFGTGFAGLLKTPLRVGRVRVDGLEIRLPPRGERPHMSGEASGQPAPRIEVQEIDCQDTTLVMLTNKPGKVPLEFDIHRLMLRSVSPGKPMSFDATLTNPKPIGDIASKGEFGPWQSEAPSETPVSGAYSFSHANLGTLKGIGGILSSTGKFHGVLMEIHVDGETDTPDFRISVSGHPVSLHTEFSAVVDGTTGDTYLQPVRAQFLRSLIVASGSVVQTPGVPGHDITLDVTINRGRIEDLLRLAVKAEKPALTGAIRLKTKLHLPPREAAVADRLQLDGSFNLAQAHFTNPQVQGKVDALSLRSRGKPEQAANDSGADALSNLKGRFFLKDGSISFSNLTFTVAGAAIHLTGNYNLNSEEFDFHGEARLQAKLSQMTTGWKSFLLKPVDPFFRRDGAGTVLPIKITGTKAHPSFGLDFGHKR